jgi:hypothetical protein
VTRLEAWLLLRRQVRTASVRRRALATEAVMEALAGRLGGEPARFGLLGLLSELDADFTAANPARRGLVAEELLAGSGLLDEERAALRAQWRAGPEDPLLVRALAAAVPAARLLLEGSADREALSALGPVELCGLLVDASIAPEASRTRVALLSPEGLAPPALLELARARLLEVVDDVFPRRSG